MNFLPFLRMHLKNENPLMSTLITRIDSIEKDGKYSKEEVSNFIKNNVIGVASIFRRKLTQEVFEAIDKGESKDGYITLPEVDVYLKETYNVSLESIKNQKLVDACKYIEEMADRKNNLK